MSATNIIPFDDLSALPAVYGDNAMFDLNTAAEEFASVKFPVISTKGGRFHVKREGVKTLITREKVRATDPDEPASYIDMAVLNLQKSKTFYVEGYTEGSEEKPDCTSNNGITPDAGVKAQQCSSCALCPHNAWGSGMNDKGEATKGKACSDVLRLAVASPANLDDAFMLRVPPASLKNFAEVSKFLSSKRIPVNGAVIRISFDVEKTGVMTFQAIGGLDAATYQKAASLKDSELVLNITGKSTLGVAHTAAPAAQAKIAAPEVKDTSAEDAAAKKAAADKAKAAKVAAAKKALEDAEKEEVTAAPAVKAEAAPAKTATSDNFEAELAALLS
jgi:hypothetical protein